ncbi:MAG: peptide deformylase [Legionellaceae bacterium]|nr:peptide deformylase [Legionellaceae bacterium]
MTLRTIIYLPHPTLRLKAKPVTQIDDDLQVLIDDMIETMYHANGVGLAAPQINVSLQLSVIDVSPTRDQPMVLINPEIIASDGSATYQEGCLSVPGVYETVTRAEKVKVKAQDRHGKWFEVEGDGLFGECLQHEIDHLNGTLFIDLLSPLKRTFARRKFEKLQKRKNA